MLVCYHNKRRSDFSLYFCAVLSILVFTLSAMSSKQKSSKPSFPQSLEDFGYTFNADGEFRRINPKTRLPGDEPFEFNVGDSKEYNQQHYEALGEVITEYVYKLLENDAGLKKLYVPREGPTDKNSFIFASEDALTNPDKLIVFIHGSGVVRAGQWARSLIINDNLKTGTQLPFIARAKELGYGVLVLNSNDNSRTINGKIVPINGSTSPTEHCDYVWNSYIKEAKAKHIAVIAHSYGGVCTVHLAMDHLPEFKERVFAVALTDSVHSVSLQKVPPDVRKLLQKVGRNWVSSPEPLDTPVPARKGLKDEDIERLSAGHSKHEMTSWSSFKSVFQFIEERYSAVSVAKQEL